MTDVAGVAPAPTPRVVLLGMMGSGKSSIGLELRERTGWPFVDNDELVEAATGRTARQLLAEQGETAMRAAESAAFHAGLALAPPVVVATAAGTILDPAHRAALRAGNFVVWLTATPEVLAGRAVGAAHRPWLDDSPAAWFRRTMAERDALYRSVADLEIDTGMVSPEMAARAILDGLAQGSGQPLPSVHG